MKYLGGIRSNQLLTFSRMAAQLVQERIVEQHLSGMSNEEIASEWGEGPTVRPPYIKGVVNWTIDKYKEQKE